MRVNMGEGGDILLDDLEGLLRDVNEFCATGNSKPEIPPSLERYLAYVAKSGNIVFPWQHVRPLFRSKIMQAMEQFPGEVCPEIETFVMERFDLFRSAPFTIQRLTELITQPIRHYNKKEKFLRGLEKTVLVVSTVEPWSVDNDKNGNDTDTDSDIPPENDDNSTTLTITPVASVSTSAVYGIDTIHSELSMILVPEGGTATEPIIQTETNVAASSVLGIEAIHSELSMILVPEPAPGAEAPEMTPTDTNATVVTSASAVLGIETLPLHSELSMILVPEPANEHVEPTIPTNPNPTETPLATTTADILGVEATEAISSVSEQSMILELEAAEPTQLTQQTEQTDVGVTSATDLGEAMAIPPEQEMITHTEPEPEVVVPPPGPEEPAVQATLETDISENI